MKKLTLFSPAKINLFLRILRKREDGYHDLASLFQAIDFGDTIEIASATDDLFTCSDPNLPCDETNLVIKALVLFRRKTGFFDAYHIHLEKRIPSEAGLGGGSSNAATVLWGLNALNNCPFSENELLQMASEIGSDIPFFFSCGTAYCEGRGEIVTNLPALSLSKQFTLFKPKEGLSTSLIFKELKMKECSRESPRSILDSFYSGNPFFINDLEVPSFRLCPILRELKKEMLASGLEEVFMTGSGTGLIGIGKNPTVGKSFHFLRREPGRWYEFN